MKVFKETVAFKLILILEEFNHFAVMKVML